MKKVVKKVKDDLCDFKQEAQRLKTIREELNKLRKDNWYKIKKSDTYKQQEARLLQEQKEIEQKHNRKQRKYWIVGIVIIFLLFFIIIEIGIATERNQPTSADTNTASAVHITDESTEAFSDLTETTTVEATTKKPESTTEKTTAAKPTTATTTHSAQAKEQTVLTVKNCPELKKLLELKNPDDEYVKAFAKEHKGDTIQFNGCVTFVSNHYKNDGTIYKTRYDVMFGYGNYNESQQKGPNFKYDNVNRTDMGYIGEGLHVGKNVKIKAIVSDYDEYTSLFFLDPVKLEDR